MIRKLISSKKSNEKKCWYNVIKNSTINLNYKYCIENIFIRKKSYVKFIILPPLPLSAEVGKNQTKPAYIILETFP